MNNKGFHHIKNMEDLQATILATKERIKLREKELAHRWERVPSETFKYAADSVATAFFNKRIVVKSFQLAKAATQKIFRKNENNETKNKSEIFSSAKKIGMYAAMGLLLNWFKKK